MRRIAVLAVLLALAAACRSGGSTGAVSEGGSTTTVAQTPATTSAPPSTSTGQASPPTTAAATTTAFPGIWPFATKAALDAYTTGPEKTFRDPVATAQGFAATYLGMDNPVTFPFSATGPGAGDVGVGPRYTEGHTTIATPRATFTVVLRQLGAQGTTGPWTVIGAASPEIVVVTPGVGVKVASPVRTTGQALAFEGAVSVTVREDGMIAAQSLGKGTVTGGGDQLRAFSGDVKFRAPTKPAGAVAYVELSAADGHVVKATVVRVRFT